MKPPIDIRNNGLWYRTNIPLPTDLEELKELYLHWNRRFHSMYRRTMFVGKSHPDWILFRMIYSRLTEIRFAIDRLLLALGQSHLTTSSDQFLQNHQVSAQNFGML